MSFAETLLRISALSYSRTDRRLFDRLEFCVNEGNALRLMGENGIGKTTLMRVLVGLIEPQTGEIFYRGQSIRELKEDYFKEILYIGHKDSLELTLSVFDNLSFFLSLNDTRVARQKLNEKLEIFGLENALDRIVGELSVGQRRKVALTRLFFERGKPLWFLDEPLTALDKESAQTVALLIQGQTKFGAVVYTTHQDITLDIEPTNNLTLDIAKEMTK